MKTRVSDLTLDFWLLRICAITYQVYNLVATMIRTHTFFGTHYLGLAWSFFLQHIARIHSEQLRTSLRNADETPASIVRVTTPPATAQVAVYR